MKKKIIVFSTFIPFAISPLIFGISCSKNNQSYSDTSTISQELKNGDFIEIKLVNNTNGTKITNLENSSFKYEMNKEKLNDENNKDYYNSVNEALDRSTIEYKGFYIPKFNDDKNTYLLFQVNTSTDYVQIPFSKIVKEEYIKNLTEEEIKNTIEKKLNEDKSFIINLKNKLQKYLIDGYYQEYINYVEQYNKNVDDNEKMQILNLDVFITKNWQNESWSPAGDETVNNLVKKEMVSYFSKTYLFFDNDRYKNIAISDINVKLENDNKKAIISFKLSTSEALLTNNGYEISTTLWI